MVTGKNNIYKKATPIIILLLLIFILPMVSSEISGVGLGDSVVVTYKNASNINYYEVMISQEFGINNNQNNRSLEDIIPPVESSTPTPTPTPVDSPETTADDTETESIVDKTKSWWWIWGTILAILGLGGGIYYMKTHYVEVEDDDVFDDSE